MNEAQGKLSRAKEHKILSDSLNDMIGIERQPIDIPLQFPLTMVYKDEKTDKTYAWTRIDKPDENGLVNIYMSKKSSMKHVENTVPVVTALMDSGLIKSVNYNINVVDETIMPEPKANPKAEGEWNSEGTFRNDI